MPQPRQAEAIKSPAFELFFGGAKGGGKTDFLLGDFLQDAPEWGEAWRGILFRRTYKELEEIIDRSAQIFGKIKGAYYKGGDQKTWYIPAARNSRFPGYATLRLRNLSGMLDVGGYQGHQYPWIAFDELTEYPTPESYEFMIGLCRSAFGAPCRIRATGNPGRPGHIWVKHRFIDVAPPYKLYIDPQTGLSRMFIPSRLEDNFVLIQKDPDYEKRLMGFQSHLVKALRWGDWDVIVGQVLEEFSRERHVIPRPNLDLSWYRFAAMDWGYAKPFSIGWYAVNEDGRVIRYKEWYGCTGRPNEGLRMDAQAVAQKAWEMSVNETVRVMVADPACWAKSGEGRSVAETFEDVGFEMVPGNNDRINGLQALHDALHAVGPDGKGMFLISERCSDWLRTVPYISADRYNPEDIDTESEDHAYDETRYALMSDFVKYPRKLLRKTKIISKPVNYNPLTYGLKQ